MIVTVTHVTYVTRFPDERPIYARALCALTWKTRQTRHASHPQVSETAIPSRAGAIA